MWGWLTKNVSLFCARCHLRYISLHYYWTLHSRFLTIFEGKNRKRNNTFFISGSISMNSPTKRAIKNTAEAEEALIASSDFLRCLVVLYQSLRIKDPAPLARFKVDYSIFHDLCFISLGSMFVAGYYHRTFVLSIIK